MSPTIWCLIKTLPPAQRHRNFFTIVFSPEGNLYPNLRRYVLLLDKDLDENGLGDRTGLPVTDESTASTEYVWFDRFEVTLAPLSSQDPGFSIAGTIVRIPLTENAAFNFRKVKRIIARHRLPLF